MASKKKAKAVKETPRLETQSDQAKGQQPNTGWEPFKAALIKARNFMTFTVPNLLDNRHKTEGQDLLREINDVLAGE